MSQILPDVLLNRISLISGPHLVSEGVDQQNVFLPKAFLLLHLHFKIIASFFHCFTDLVLFCWPDRIFASLIKCEFSPV